MTEELNKTKEDLFRTRAYEIMARDRISLITFIIMDRERCKEEVSRLKKDYESFCKEFEEYKEKLKFLEKNRIRIRKKRKGR